MKNMTHKFINMHELWFDEYLKSNKEVNPSQYYNIMGVFDLMDFNSKSEKRKNLVGSFYFFPYSFDEAIKSEEFYFNVLTLNIPTLLIYRVMSNEKYDKLPEEIRLNPIQKKRYDSPLLINKNLPSSIYVVNIYVPLHELFEGKSKTIMDEFIYFILLLIIWFIYYILKTIIIYWSMPYMTKTEWRLINTYFIYTICTILF